MVFTLSISTYIPLTLIRDLENLYFTVKDS
ncbi:hypothetical protein LINPERHAP1_LOCUS20253 [Linum perenne]